MAAELAVRAPAALGRSPGTVVAGLTARRAVRSGRDLGLHLWRCYCLVGSQLHEDLQDHRRTRRPGGRLRIEQGDRRALFGPAPQLQTVAGFTVFKISMTLIILGAVWGLLTSTRLLRGEEDSGRWEVLLAGQTTRRGAAAQALGGLGAGVLVLWAVTAVITIVAGQDSNVGIAAGPALYFALAMVATAVMFLAVGALTSQLAATRRQAASYAAAFLGVAYAVRMIADAGVGLHGADLGFSARLGRGAPAPHRTPAARPAPDGRLHRGGGRRGRRTRRHPRRRGEPRCPTGPAADRTCGCCPDRPGWRYGWCGR